MTVITIKNIHIEPCLPDKGYLNVNVFLFNPFSIYQSNHLTTDIFNYLFTCFLNALFYLQVLQFHTTLQLQLLSQLH